MVKESTLMPRGWGRVARAFGRGIQFCREKGKVAPWEGIAWVFGGIALFAVSLRYFHGAERAVDIALSDETFYMARGLWIMRDGMPLASMAPFYSLWYYLLSLCVRGDAASLFYLNYMSLTILLPILLYLVLWRVGVRFLAAFMLSSWLLVCYVNFPIQPKVTHWAAAVTLATLFFSSLASPSITGWGVGAVGALLVSYIRPEFFILFLFLSVVCLCLCVYQRRELRGRRLRGIIGCVLISGIILGCIGRPAFKDDAGRGIWAFSQYFGMRWVPRTGSHLNPATDWKKIRDINFGPVNTFFGAVRANPSAVINHVTINVCEFPGAWWRLVCRHLPLFRGGLFGDVEGGVIGWILTILAVLFVLPSLLSVRARSVRYGRTVLLAGLFLGPALLSSLLMYPVPHFMGVTTVTLFLLAGFILCGDQWKWGGGYTLTLSVMCVLFVCFFATPLSRSIHPQMQRPNFAVIQFIKKFDIKEPVNLLEGVGGFHIYLGENFRMVSHFRKDEPFRSYASKNDINAIVLDRNVMQCRQYAQDPEWQDFLKNYQKGGFVGMDIPDSGRALLIKREFLQ